MPSFDLTIRGTGAVLRRLREARGLTLEQAADLVGDHLHPDALDWFERNHTGAPFSRLLKLAEVYGLTPEGLLAECLGYARERGVPVPAYDAVRKAGES